MQLLTTAVSYRTNAQLPAVKKKLPNFLASFFKEKTLSPEEKSLSKRKIFLNYLRIMVFMLIFSPAETLEALVPVIDTPIVYIKTLTKNGM